MSFCQRIFCTLLLCLISYSSSYSQADVWFLGNNISIDFSSGTAVVGTGIVIGADLTESSTSITDPSGKLLFSVVGDNVYDGGKNSVLTLPSATWDVAQGTMVIPVPGKTNEYYLTVLKNGTGASTKPMAVYYTIKTSGTGAGNLTITGPANLAANLTQSQTGVPKLNPDGTVSSDFWLISHQLCNNSFQLFTVSGTGITNSGTSSTGPNFDCINTWPPKYDDIGTLKFNGCYTQASYIMGDKVMLFDFDAKTGQFTHKNTITTGLSSAYSMEFSPDGKYAYVITGQDNNNPGHLYRMAVTGAGFGAPVDLGTTGGMRGGHLQLGPDGNIYFAAPQSYGNLGTGYIGRITNPNGGGVVDKTWYKAAAEDNNTAKIEGQAVNMDMPNFLKSLVVPLPKLLVDGVELSQTSVCQGQSVKFELSVSGSVSANVDWVATGANTGTQNGGASFTMSMANSGTTNVTATVTDECGREKDVPFIVEVEAYQNANGTLATCPSRVVTGAGSTSGNYAWYTADPAGGGTFLGYGATYDAAGKTSVWVQPVGTITQTSINDNRSAQNYGSATGNTSITLTDGSASINSFVVGMYTWGTYSGNLTVELRNGSNQVIGTPFTQAVTGTGEKNITVSPTDWKLPSAGTYSVVITSAPTGASFGQLTASSYSSGTVSINGGRTVDFGITTYEESATSKCIKGKLVAITSCCTQLAPTVTGGATVCEGSPSIVLTATKNVVTTGTVTYQWYNDDGIITGATSATYSVATTSAFAAKNYWATVTSSASCSGESPISNKVIVTINAQPSVPTITLSPVKTDYCVGEAHTLTAASTISGGVAITYTWTVDATGTGAIKNGLTTLGGHTYTVEASTPAGCKAQATKTTNVNALPDSTITQVGPFCSDGAAVNLTAATAGGTWKVDATALVGSSFDPKLYTVGSHQIHYNVTANGCSSHDTITVQITQKKNASITAVSPMCANANTVTLVGADAGGVWSGTGITNTATGEFNPKVSGAGTFTITYAIAGSCGDSKTTSITVNATDSAKILPAGPFCSVDPAYTMKLTSGSTTGGTWSGTGVSAGGVFSPSTGNGTYNLTYTTSGACPESDNINVTVANSVTLNITSTKDTYCHNANKDTIEVTALGGTFSTWSGKGIVDADFGYYDPKLANVGTDTIWYMKAGSCGDTTFKVITVTDIDTAKITTHQGPFCQSQGVVTLHKEALSDAGTWSGTGITNGATGAFDPSIGAGNYLITYTTSGACPVQDTATVKVFGQMVANIVTGDTSVCKNAIAKQIRLSANTTPGGTWLSLPTAGMVSSTGLFTPSSAGVFKVYYGIAGATLGCSAVDSVLIAVSAIDTAKISMGQGPFCLNDPVQTLQVETASSAGVWSGTGITNGATGSFTPSTAGVGGKLITYKTSGVCWVQDTMTVYVVNQMVANITSTAASVCEDAGLYTIQMSGNTTPGGTWSSVPAGVLNSGGQFDPSLATAGTTYKVLYSVNGATATCSAKDSIDITVVPREDATITTSSPMAMCIYDAPKQINALNSGGTWSGNGVSASGLFTVPGAGTYKAKYTMTGTSGLCPDADSINVVVLDTVNSKIQPATSFCQNLGTQQLVPVVAGGTFSGTATSTQGLFDPKKAPAGTYIITYTQGGACPTTGSIEVTIDSLPYLSVKPLIGGCVPITVAFADSSTASVTSATWTFGDGSSATVTSPDASTAHTYVNYGTFNTELTVTFTNGCIDTASASVTVAEVPVADFSFDPIPASTNNPQITFTNQSTGAGTYFWNFGPTGAPDTSVSVNEEVLFDAPDGDTIPVILIAKNSVCADTINKDVYIKGAFTLFTENAFTPNGDGNNDLFYPKGRNHVCDECTNYQFLVFDRWGEVIYKSATPYEGWNGKRSNTMRDAEIDVYVWKLVYTDSFTGKEAVAMGHITLLR
ncbi:MAG: T9SS type B sorting domain-containing protein [Flavobacteriales bacterium]